MWYRNIVVDKTSGLSLDFIQLGDTVDSEIFARILFSRIALKDILVM